MGFCNVDIGIAHRIAELSVEKERIIMLAPLRRTHLKGVRDSNFDAFALNQYIFD